MSARTTYGSVALIVLALALAGCGGRSPASTHGSPVRPASQTRADDVTCAQLETRAAAQSLARTLVDRLIAPQDHTERQTVGTITESLYATCRQPKLPGVADPKDYKPVKPVLAAIQRDFDEEEITGH